jgi:hypothetical protein
VITVVAFLLVAGLLFSHFADHWKQDPRGLVKAIPLGSLFIGAISGLARFLKELSASSLPRSGFDIVACHMGVFGGIGFAIQALFQ